jgi:hypothetical protein
VTGFAIALLGVPALANPPPNVVEITDAGNYGPGIERKVDVCMPVQSTAPGWVPEPTVVLVHGGSWGNLGFDSASSGDDKSDTLVENRCWDLAARGYIVVKIDYPRMAAGGSTTSDTQFAAVQRAIRWVRHGDLAALVTAQYAAFQGMQTDPAHTICEGWDAGGGYCAMAGMIPYIWPGQIDSLAYPGQAVSVALLVNAYGWTDPTTFRATDVDGTISQALWGNQPTSWMPNAGTPPAAGACPTPTTPTSLSEAWCFAPQFVDLNGVPNTSLQWILVNAIADSLSPQIRAGQIPRLQAKWIADGYGIFQGSACGGNGNCGTIIDGGHDGCGLSGPDFSILAGLIDDMELYGVPATTPTGYAGMDYPSPPPCQ